MDLARLRLWPHLGLPRRRLLCLGRAGGDRRDASDELLARVVQLAQRDDLALKNSASVQSTTTRTLRLNVGTRLMWYVRCMNHAGQPA